MPCQAALWSLCIDSGFSFVGHFYDRWRISAVTQRGIPYDVLGPRGAQDAPSQISRQMLRLQSRRRSRSDAVGPSRALTRGAGMDPGMPFEPIPLPARQMSWESLCRGSVGKRRFGWMGASCAKKVRRFFRGIPIASCVPRPFSGRLRP